MGSDEVYISDMICLSTLRNGFSPNLDHLQYTFLSEILSFHARASTQIKRLEGAHSIAQIIFQ